MMSLLLLLGFIHCFHHFLRHKFHKYPDEEGYDDNIIGESEKKYKVRQRIHGHENITKYSQREEEFCCEWRFWMLKCFPGVPEFFLQIFKTSNKVEEFHRENDYSPFRVASFSSSRRVFQFLVVAVTASFLSKNMVENFVIPYPSGQYR